MPRGWVIEAITRQAGTTLVTYACYDVAIEDESAARAAVEDRLRGVFSVRVETLSPIPEQRLHALGLAPGDVKPH